MLKITPLSCYCDSLSSTFAALNRGMDEIIELKVKELKKDVC